MSVAKSLLLSIALLFMAAVSGSAQNMRKTDARGGKLGILVGLSSDGDASQGKDGSPVLRYETRWIVHDRGGAHVAAKIPDVILPRKEGFWRAGIQATCQLRPRDKSDADDRGEIITKDIEYAVPIGQTPRLALDDPACDAATANRVLEANYAPNAETADANTPAECRWARKSFMSVLPDLVSTYSSEGMRESCDPHQHEEYSAHAQSPDDLQTDIPFGENIQRKGRVGMGSCDLSGTSEGSVFLFGRATARSRRLVFGAWRGSLALMQWGPYTADCVFSADANVSVPRALTHAAPLSIPWAELEKELPGVSDAYASPDGSVLVAIQSKEDRSNHEWRVSSIGIFDFSGNKVSAKFLDLPPTAIMMVEWATAAYVAKWADVLSGFEKRGVPRPLIAVVANPDSTPAK